MDKKEKLEKLKKLYEISKNPILVFFEDIEKLKEVIEKLSGGLTLTEQEIALINSKLENEDFLSQVASLVKVPDPIKGDKGDTYTLTEVDKKEIAGKIEPTVVDKIIERTEVIREIPIVTEKVVQVAVVESAEKIVQKINELPINEEDKKIGVEHISGIKKLFDEWVKKLNLGKTIYVGGSTGGGRIVKSYDLSSQLNGVLKTFSLPAFYRVISVHSSSVPGAFRETVDWTSDGTAMTLTFTSEITASSTLATGQTITVIYSEA